MTNKRYVHILWDGIFDKHNDPELETPLTQEEIVDVMNDTYNQIKVWQRKYDEMKRKYYELKKQL